MSASHSDIPTSVSAVIAASRETETDDGPAMLGLLGGMSFESTALYYRLINEEVRRRLGGVHSARVLVHSFDFEEVIALQRAGDWSAAAILLGDAAEGLQLAGADPLICTNTMHTVAREVQARVPIPLLDIDVTATRAHALGLTRVGLTGTVYTMRDGFNAERLLEHGLEVVLPGADDRRFLQWLIFEQLAAGRFTGVDRWRLKSVIDRLAQHGAQGTILGCTELELLLDEREDGRVLLRTTRLHAHAAHGRPRPARAFCGRRRRSRADVTCLASPRNPSPGQPGTAPSWPPSEIAAPARDRLNRPPAPDLRSASHAAQAPDPMPVKPRFGVPGNLTELPLDRVDLRAAGRRVARRGALLLAVTAGAFGLFVLYGGGATDLLGAGARALRADWGWMLPAVAFEGLSFAGYIVLFQLVAGRTTTRVGLRASAQITLAGAATTRLLPTAGLGGLALTVWALRRAGLRVREATTMTIAFLYLLYSVYITALILAGLGLIAGLGSYRAPMPLTLGGAIIGALAAGAALLAGRSRSVIVAEGAPVRRLAALRAKLAELGPVLRHGRMLAITVGKEHPPQLLGALAWWGFDLAVLWCTFHAFGTPLPVIAAVMAYFLGTLANTLPIPGAVSTSMIAVHVAFGLPIAVVIPAVLAYRAIALWLPAVAGGLALPGLRRTTRAWAAANAP